MLNGTTNHPTPGRRDDMMGKLTVCDVSIENNTINCRTVEASAISGDLVFDGLPTRSDIIKAANSQLVAPWDGYGDYNNFEINLPDTGE